MDLFSLASDQKYAQAPAAADTRHGHLPAKVAAWASLLSALHLVARHAMLPDASGNTIRVGQGVSHA